ncbi:helix-turn-helix transcriptional regulator [Clostridium botulinum]|nr:helix-turn-helix transcriptional regulator [Clostridium botulinum]
MLGDNIKELRIKKGLTQEELGKMLNKTKNNISQYETGKREPDIDTLIKLSNLFSVSINRLVGKEEKVNSIFAELLVKEYKNRNIDLNALPIEQQKKLAKQITNIILTLNDE